VYHATDKATAEKFAREGIDTKDKPTNLARQRYEKGEYAEYAPGRGLSGGLSIGSTPADVSGYGPAIVAVNIAKGDLAVPPEQQVLNTPTGGHALASNDAVVFGRIPPSRIVYLGSNNPKAYRQNPGPAHEEFVKYALRNDKDVPAQVRQDYPDIAEKL
jgi:hypothetical protein